MTAQDLLRLEEFDTPTICNALEMIEPERRGFGYTTRSVLATNAHVGPRVGLAFTATMRSLNAPPIAGEELKQQRLAYYRYMYEDTFHPKTCVMQDLDGDEAGRGPFWGEFNVRIHRSMGFRAIVTDGSIRDVAKLPDDLLMLSRGLRPSHAYVHIASFNEQVNVFGMAVNPGDVVHADAHGAVAFPLSLATEVAHRADEFVEAERPVMEACKSGQLTLAKLEQLYMSRGAFGDERPRT